MGSEDQKYPIRVHQSRADGLEEISSCNLCGSQDVEDVYPSTWVRRCCACGYGFRSPRPTVEAIARFYSRDGKYAHWLDEMAERAWCWRYRLKLLRRFVQSGRLLDVGAGIGEFLERARKFFDVTGTEVSDEAIGLARERFGIEVLHGTLEQVQELKPGSFEVVSLVHVLEHVPDPTRTIARCRELLRPEGWLYVAVPNDSPAGWYKSYWGAWRTFRRLVKRNAPKVSYRETPPLGSVDLRNADTNAEIHLSHFSPELLRDFLSHNGFDVVYMGPDPCFTTTGLRRFKDRLDFRACALLYAALGVYCYSTVSVVAKSRVAT